MRALRLTPFFALLLVPKSLHAEPPHWGPQHRIEILREYLGLLSVPNVASDAENIRRNAELIIRMMASRGLSPQLLKGDEPSPPAVFGEWKVPGAKRTVVFYAHYDGQPVTPAAWKSTAPFEPKLYSGGLDQGARVIPVPSADVSLDPEWRLYGRSSSDDKLGVMAILAAVDELKAQRKRPSFNLKIFFEGEEEAGSPHLAAILAKNRSLLSSDGWVIIDGPNHPTGAPQVSLGVRGDVNLELTVFGPVRPLHSGHYGNWAPNPALMLSRLLVSMKDASGKVTIDGFYDDVIPLTERERQTIDAIPDADVQLRSELGLGWTEGNGRRLAELVTLPSLNINGMRSADIGKQARNVIPSTATADLDLRLVLGNDHDIQVMRVIDHIKRQGYTVLDHDPSLEERHRFPLIAKVTRDLGYNAARTPLDHPLARSLIAAMKQNGPVVIVPAGGGSLPLYIFGQELGAATVTVSLANYDNNQHAEDENLRLGNLWSAIDLVVAAMRMK